MSKSLSSWKSFAMWDAKFGKSLYFDFAPSGSSLESILRVSNIFEKEAEAEILDIKKEREGCFTCLAL
jgi:hypothetical protein